MPSRKLKKKYVPFETGSERRGARIKSQRSCTRYRLNSRSAPLLRAHTAAPAAGKSGIGVTGKANQ